MSDGPRQTRRRWRRDVGQATSEYVLLTGMLVLIAVMMFNVLGGSVREAFKSTTRRMLSVVTGEP
jgi:Flp pilus assembly pilin Flp